MSMLLKTATMAAAAAGAHTTVAADDDVATGLREVHFAFAVLQSDPAIDAAYVTVEIPNQATSPGVISIKTWQPTAAGNTAVIAATAFSKVVNWIALGE